MDDYKRFYHTEGATNPPSSTPPSDTTPPLQGEPISSRQTTPNSTTTGQEPRESTVSPDNPFVPKQVDMPRKNENVGANTTVIPPTQGNLETREETGSIPSPTPTSPSPDDRYRGQYQEPAFYGDPHAPIDPSPLPPSFQPMPHVSDEKPVKLNRGLTTASVVCMLLLFFLSCYCILADIFNGALGTSVESGTTEVTLTQESKPALDSDSEYVTSDGTYTVQGVAALVTPSIVEIYNYTGNSIDDDDLEGTGSGIIITEDGYIITNAHVVTGDTFVVVLSDESTYQAQLIGSDSKTDLAVIKISAKGLIAAELGDSDETEVGEAVVAIGNPAGLTGTVTSGIVSAVGRMIRSDTTGFEMECLQTDAAVSPGNSGGALVNMYGQVIGIVSSKYSSSILSSASYEGLGFAITINEALPVIEDLIENGYVSGRFRIGISFYGAEDAADIFLQSYEYEMPEELYGLWVTDISDECDIYNTELAIGDFILEVEGVAVQTYDDVIAVLDGYSGGDEITVTCASYDSSTKKITYYEITFALMVDTSGDY